MKKWLIGLFLLEFYPKFLEEFHSVVYDLLKGLVSGRILGIGPINSRLMIQRIVPWTGKDPFPWSSSVIPEIKLFVQETAIVITYEYVRSRYI